MVIITGGIHGDEPAGAAAAEEIRQWKILRGTLAVLPRANPPALAAHARYIPGVDREQGNLNRNFPKAGRPGPAAGEPAQAIWDWVQSLNPTWLVDLHEGAGIRTAGSKSVGSSIIVCPSPEAEHAAQLMLEAVNATIQDSRHKFVRLRQAVDGSLARAASAHLQTHALILETSVNDPPPSADKKRTATKDGQAASRKSKQQPLSRRVRQQRLMVQALLLHLGMIDASGVVVEEPLP
jgi:predicted deacylase